VGAYVGWKQAIYSGRITGDVGRPRMDHRQRGQNPDLSRLRFQNTEQAEQQCQ